MMCGVDEAGRGSVIGPLVVAAVYSESDSAFKRIGVKDSKKLSPNIREKMYTQIQDECEIHTVIFSASEIDELRDNMTLNDIELSMFIDACSDMPVSAVYADCPSVNEYDFSRKMRVQMNNANIVAEHKADDTYPIVSAASIVAKVTRDRMIKEIQNGFDVNIGSGYPSDRCTMEFIEKWIKDNGCPPPHTRCSWEPIRQMMTISKNTKICDW